MKDICIFGGGDYGGKSCFVFSIPLRICGMWVLLSFSHSMIIGFWPLQSLGSIGAT